MRKSENKMGSRLAPDSATSGSKRKGKQHSSRKNRRKAKTALRKQY